MVLCACTSTREKIPGAYSGELTSNDQASLMRDRRPDGKGGFVAKVTHYSGSTTTAGARVAIRDVGDVHGHPTFSADLAGICSLRFQLLEGGRLASNLEQSVCGCVLDGERVAGQTSVTGSYREGTLTLDIDVSLRGTETYTGGCVHTFHGKRQP